MSSPDVSSEIRGPRGVRHDVCDFLRATLPSHLTGCEVAWGLAPGTLEAPVSAPDDPRADAYMPFEPPALDRWPLVAVTTGARAHRGPVDTDDDGSPVFRTVYPVRVWSWLRTENRGPIQDLRDDYGTALGVLLAAHPSLGAGGRLNIDLRTMKTEFSRVEKVTGDRYVAGSYVAFDLHATETLTDRLAMPGQQPRDTVSGVKVTGTVLPRDGGTR